MTKLPWYLRARRRPSTCSTAGRQADVLRLVARAPHGQHRRRRAADRPLLARARSRRRSTSRRVQSIIVGGGAVVTGAGRARPASGSAPAYSIRYSSTECGGCGTGTAFDADDDEALHTVGRPRPGVEVSIRDDDGAGPGRRGRRGLPPIRRRDGPLLERPRGHRRHASGDGWLHTGDLGYRRRTRACCASPGGARRCTSGAATTCTRWRSRPRSPTTPPWPRSPWSAYPDDVLGERGLAVVVPTDPARPADARRPLLNTCGDASRPTSCPSGCASSNALPLTAMHKVDRRALTTDASPP